MKILLIMRNTYAWHREHIEALERLGLEIHLVTKVPGAEDDARFASVIRLPDSDDTDAQARFCAAEARRLGIASALTFYDSDIVLASQVNLLLGHAWPRPEADEISRDKRRQRDFLERHGLPSPRFAAVTDAAQGLAAARAFTFPFIVKPSALAASIGVSLVRDEEELRRALADVTELVRQWGGYFPSDGPEIALLEEFLPGREVTLDGVVLAGRFHLAGVTNKMQMPGPYFEEDYYTLPFRTPEEEPELVAVAEAVTAALGLEHCLFNAELRQDAEGRYRIVEFATRMSGGQNYRNLREVHGLDAARLYAKAVLAGDDPAARAAILDGEVPRAAVPRAATCIKFAYREGRLMRNNAGDAAHSPYFRSYIPASRTGERLRRAPEGWYEIAGSLAVAAPYRSAADVDRVEQLAADLDERLDVVVVPA
ncbi:ATP-grasp domain-containing protein [Actinacidiphila yeochonensis]|uniref:ATP-grasp domain-containing protein n=1 Tax=Actinacidiphila yeochonensis TaxID=89050 RepID=UPI00056B2A99|nr:ATP-grasp domain-containing protein [Actinacidiphila yeochonensis]